MLLVEFGSDSLHSSQGTVPLRQTLGDTVLHGQPMARIYNALDGTLMQTIVSPCDGVITCRYDYPLMFQNAVAYRIAQVSTKNDPHD